MALPDIEPMAADASTDALAGPPRYLPAADDVPFERFVVGVDELFLIDRRSRFVALRRRLGNRRVEVSTERGVRLCELARGV